MSNLPAGDDPLHARLKTFIVASLRLRNIKAEAIPDDEPLIGGIIGLDSLDVIELAMLIEDEFGITLRDRTESQAALANIASLAGFIRTHARDHHAGGQQVRISA